MKSQQSTKSNLIKGNIINYEYWLTISTYDIIWIRWHWFHHINTTRWSLPKVEGTPRQFYWIWLFTHFNFQFVSHLSLRIIMYIYRQLGNIVEWGNFISILQTSVLWIRILRYHRITKLVIFLFRDRFHLKCDSCPSLFSIIRFDSKRTLTIYEKPFNHSSWYFETKSLIIIKFWFMHSSTSIFR